MGAEVGELVGASVALGAGVDEAVGTSLPLLLVLPPQPALSATASEQLMR